MRRGANVQVAYYDQQREQLDPERTVFETVGDGNDWVTVNGSARHVNAYLADFLFPPERASSPVKALSGGERNRLLLARLFTRPANVLVLDEPSNDLDLETLELLEAELVDWPGTLLISPRPCLPDNVVTSTFRFERATGGSGVCRGLRGPLRQRSTPPSLHLRPPESAAGNPGRRRASRRHRPGGSYREQRETHDLPARIDGPKPSRAAQRRRSGSAVLHEACGRHSGVPLAPGGGWIELLSACARWDELTRALVIGRLQLRVC